MDFRVVPAQTLGVTAAADGASVSSVEKPEAMITKSQLIKRPGWGAKRIQRDLGDPDEVQQQPGQIVKLYSLECVEAVEANSPAPPPARRLPHKSKKATESTKRRPGNTKKARGSAKPRSRKTGMTPDREDALAGSMLAQLKDGISDDELMETTWSAAALRRRGWTDTLIRDLLGEPHWLTPNPKYPNAGAPMKLWDRRRVGQLERTDVWRQRRSRRNAPSQPAAAGRPMDNLALVDGWHSADGEIWHLLGAPMFPRVLASARRGGCWLMIMPPVEGHLTHLWDAEAYAEMIEQQTGETPDWRPIGDAYEKCSGCGCPLAHSDEPVGCPSCGMPVATLALDDATKSLQIVVIHPRNEQALLNAARSMTPNFMQLHSRWLRQHER